jgi:hypothetical protein
VGRPPFQADTIGEQFHMIVHEEPVPPRRLNRAIPVDVETICLKCLQKKQADRYASAADLAADLRHVLNGEPIAASRASRSYRFRKRLVRHWRALALVCLTALITAAVVLRVHDGVSKSSNPEPQVSSDPTLFGSYRVEEQRFIQAFDRAGRPLWRRDMGAGVAAHAHSLGPGDDAKVLVGLRRSGVSPGAVAMLNAAGDEVWRYETVMSSPEGGRVVMGVRSLIVRDLLASTGNEVVAVCTNRANASCVRILSSRGGPLTDTMWFDGVLLGVTGLVPEDRYHHEASLVFWGYQDRTESTHTTRYIFPEKATHVLFAVPPEQVHGRVVFANPGSGAPPGLLWYAAFERGSCSINQVTTSTPQGTEGARLNVDTNVGWSLLLDDTGQVVDEGKGPDAIGACPRLETTVVAPRLLPPSRTVEEDRGSERLWDWRRPLLIPIAIVLILPFVLLVRYVLNGPIWSCPDCKAEVRLSDSRCGNCGMEAPAVMGCLAPVALVAILTFAILIAWFGGKGFDAESPHDRAEETHQTSEHPGQETPKPPG